MRPILREPDEQLLPRAAILKLRQKLDQRFLFVPCGCSHGLVFSM